MKHATNAFLDGEVIAFDARRRSGDWILKEVEHYLGRFVAYPSEHARVAHTLWIAHTHLMDCWEVYSANRFCIAGARLGENACIRDH